MFNSDNLPHELFLATRQTTKIRNAIENNMSADTKLSKAQIKKNNYVRWCSRINFRKTSCPIIKDCYTISNKSSTSFRIECCNERY